MNEWPILMVRMLEVLDNAVGYAKSRSGRAASQEEMTRLLAWTQEVEVVRAHVRDSQARALVEAAREPVPPDVQSRIRAWAEAIESAGDALSALHETDRFEDALDVLGGVAKIGRHLTMVAGPHGPGAGPPGGPSRPGTRP